MTDRQRLEAFTKARRLELRRCNAAQRKALEEARRILKEAQKSIMATLTAGGSGGSRFERQGRAKGALPPEHLSRPQERTKDGQPTEWQSHHLARLQGEINRAMRQAGEALEEVTASQTGRMYQLGLDLVDGPLKAAGVVVDAAGAAAGAVAPPGTPDPACGHAPHDHG